MDNQILVVAGARPNFIKVAPLLAELKRPEGRLRARLVHTGQHYDPGMSDVFFRDLGMMPPDHSLGVGSGSHAEQTAAVMVAFEEVCLRTRPSLVVVVGDVNSTLACALTAKKLWIPVAHVEAGLRSRDMRMPEEVNRLLTDSISDYLFTPSPDADDNLRHEGISEDRITRVGNIMIDSLVKMLHRARESGAPRRFALERNCFGLVTVHRPSNVDDFTQLKKTLSSLELLETPLVFPVHPRTRARLEDAGLGRTGRLRMIDPLGYVDFLSFMTEAAFVVTDSGGIQEETTYLGIPCFTLREQTERPITVTIGTNQLVTVDDVGEKVEGVLRGKRKQGQIPELWDGKTAERIVTHLESELP